MRKDTMDYTTAQKTLNNRTSRKLENNTYLKQIDKNTIGVLLHGTFVVKFTPQTIELNSGGWRTPTTKDRINKYSASYITQKNSIWYMNDGSIFYDGMTTNSKTGHAIKPKTDSKHEAKVDKMKEKIRKFATYATDKVKKGVEAPKGGDCWYCALATENNVALGDAIDNSDHLVQHMKDKYVVPSLVWNAIKEAGYQYPEIIMGYDTKTMRSGARYMADYAVKKSIVKYMQKRLLKNLL